jgi:hypothetical protein
MLTFAYHTPLPGVIAITFEYVMLLLLAGFFTTCSFAGAYAFHIARAKKFISSIEIDAAETVLATAGKKPPYAS